MRIALPLIFALVSMSAAAQAQPVGTFTIEGRNPSAASGPPTYTGTLTITSEGDSYSVVWLVGAARIRVEGRGLYQNGVFSVAYNNTQPPGPAIVVYVRRRNTWVGRWSIPGTPGVGTEILTPQGR